MCSLLCLIAAPVQSCHCTSLSLISPSPIPKKSYFSTGVTSFIIAVYHASLVCVLKSFIPSSGQCLQASGMIIQVLMGVFFTDNTESCLNYYLDLENVLENSNNFHYTYREGLFSFHGFFLTDNTESSLNHPKS